jgi:hypothetical protein
MPKKIVRKAILTQVITQCTECAWTNNGFYCRKVNRPIEHVYPQELYDIPEWCPLLLENFVEIYLRTD